MPDGCQIHGKPFYLADNLLVVLRSIGLPRLQTVQDAVVASQKVNVVFVAFKLRCALEIAGIANKCTIVQRGPGSDESRLIRQNMSENLFIIGPPERAWHSVMAVALEKAMAHSRKSSLL